MSNMRKLEIGSGNNPQPGYEHLEINKDCPHVEMCCDCSAIPQPDNTYDEVIAFHVLEHTEWLRAEALLREWHRVLKPGGIIKLAMPDLEYVVHAYMDDTDAIWKKELAVPGWSFPAECHTDKTAWLNFKLYSTDIPHNLHKACFDAKWLSKILERVGFVDIQCIGGLAGVMSLNASARKKS